MIKLRELEGWECTGCGDDRPTKIDGTLIEYYTIEIGDTEVVLCRDCLDGLKWLLEAL